MIHLFYIASMIILFIELRWISSPKEKSEESKRFSELTKLHKGKNWDEYSKEYKSELKSGLFLLFVPLWLFIGLFTFQWAAFLIILLFNLIIVTPLSKLTRYSIAFTVLHWINSVIGFSFAMFVILNKYHLHINVYELVKQMWLRH